MRVIGPAPAAADRSLSVVPATRLASDYAQMPLWMLDASLPRGSHRDLPRQVDVLIVGAGYTGLSAAREMAAAGRSTVALDAAGIGGGCSSRNGGQVAFSLKPDYGQLARRYGEGRARALFDEGVTAVEFLRDRVREERLDCDWRDSGCFIGACTPRHFGVLERIAEEHVRRLPTPVKVISRADQHTEIDSRFYHGGLVYPADHAVHPLKLLNALHGRAVSAGVEVYDHCPVLGLVRDPAGFLVHTARGLIKAGQVLLATNGYTGPLSPWHRRRIVPIGSYQIATECLEPEFVRSLVPKGRNLGDTRHVVTYARPSPDGRRMVFGGRAAASEQDVTRCVPRLVSMMTDVFPQLTGVAISHAWMGFVAFTFDSLPHLGDDDGLFYCMGYCGQGIPLSVYYGRKIALKMLGASDSQTALDGLVFQTRPLYAGVPWFLPAVVAAYRIRDRLGW